MAGSAVVSAMNGDADKLHPFFTRQHANAQASPPESGAHESPAAQDLHSLDEKTKTTKSKRKKTSGEVSKKRLSDQKSLGFNLQIDGPVSEPGNAEPDINPGPRKRRRTTGEDNVTVNREPLTDEGTNPPRDERSYSPQVVIPGSSPLPVARTTTPSQHDGKTLVPKTPPKKLLKINANGKFSSPPLKKIMLGELEVSATPKRRTRGRKSKDSSSEKHLLVKLRYGSSDSERQKLGDKIDHIFDDRETSPVADVRETPKKRTSHKLKAAKPTHPFFSKGGFQDDRGEKSLAMDQSPRKTSAVTPGKLRVQSMCGRCYDTGDTSLQVPSALLRDRLMVKHPGAREPPFPNRDQTHVRSLENHDSVRSPDKALFYSTFPPRKRKTARLALSEGDSILSRFASKLTVEDEPPLQPDGYREPDVNLTVPKRLLISGQEIAARVKQELTSNLSGIDVEDELSVLSQTGSHPALRRLYGRILATATAHDETRGEIQPWTQKYAPAASADVLQSEQEMTVVRDWLKSLAVQSVISTNSPPVKASKAPGKPKKKKKRKPNEMEDFILDNDEDTREMSEIIQNEEAACSTIHKNCHSVVQEVTQGTKLSNAVLLAGPHGCGKTAVAYAVARELGFKIFEINSSERRSGRDIIDKVGDMTENHLVKHHGSESEAAPTEDAEPDKFEEVFQKDLQSGKQGKMSAFFKPQAKLLSKKKPSSGPKKNTQEDTLKALEQLLKKPSKEQQQSLILIEEADILFKEDKDFWATVLKLIQTSKRPFIMTCNDEDLVPLQAMSLHAILRFAQPPLALATDYMLLVAAAEGHLLERVAVESLYRRHNSDLRASLTELDFWCQMGVGDPRSGLSWIYQRWPPGSDLDDLGRKLRVVSDGTYDSRMGMPNNASLSEEALLWTWTEVGVEPATALGWEGMAEDQPKRSLTTTGDENRPSLKNFSDFADALSVADIFYAPCSSETALLDTTQPEMAEKARCHYIESMVLLQIDERVDWTGMNREMATSATHSAFRTFQSSNPESRDIVNQAQSRKVQTNNDKPFSRRDFACLDPIAVAEDSAVVGNGLQMSILDGAVRPIALDVAPYVRSTLRYEQALEEQRDRLDLASSSSNGGRKSKRARTTRAARSALEGGLRATIRREHWFTSALDREAVLATGGKAWPMFSEDAVYSSGSLGSVSAGSPAPPSITDSEEIRYEA